MTNSPSLTGLRRPDGTLVQSGDPNVQITDLSSARIFVVTKPSIGSWQAEISSGGDFSVLAQGNSPIEFRRFDFVQANDDVHGGFFPIPGQPLAGSDATGEATLLGPFSSTTFRLDDANGEVLKTVPLAQNFPDAARDRFLGTFQSPSVPFRIVADGKDTLGNAFLREFPTLYRAQSVGVTVDGPTVVTVPVGANSTFVFNVTNIGGATTFQINAADGRGFPIIVTPTSLNLLLGQSAPVAVQITIPTGTADATPFTITVTATRVDDPTVFNSAIVNATAIVNRPPDISKTHASTNVLWPPNHAMVPITIVGSTDPDGDPVSIHIDRVTQDEPTDGHGDGDTCPDAQIGTSTLQLRSERSGTGNGRVYVISFTASDGRGGSASGTAKVAVPHDHGHAAIDDERGYDSTSCSIK